jgi:hypothetical protein
MKIFEISRTTQPHLRHRSAAAGYKAADKADHTIV